MKIGALVQARMGSKRLPGKTLQPVQGKPLLQYLLERLGNAECLDGIVVATSDAEADSQIAAFCTKAGVPVFRGSLFDVAGRVAGALEAHPFDAFVRVNGDSPLLDQRLVDRGIRLFRQGTFDLVTNVHPRTYPKGESIEIVKSSTFSAAYRDMAAGEDLEHVTRYFYKNEGRFRICNFESKKRCRAIQLSVDTPEDMSLFSAIVSRMTRPHWTYTLEEILGIHHSLRAEGRGVSA
jgi:spore coat polysaccharide biosynthesis protein SpsF